VVPVTWFDFFGAVIALAIVLTLVSIEERGRHR
jgi:hypothetical protein